VVVELEVGIPVLEATHIEVELVQAVVNLHEDWQGASVMSWCMRMLK